MLLVQDTEEFNIDFNVSNVSWYRFHALKSFLLKNGLNNRKDYIFHRDNKDLRNPTSIKVKFFKETYMQGTFVHLMWIAEYADKISTI